MTPHESALGGGDERDYNPIGINVKGYPALILRSIAKRCVSKDGAAPWFETRLRRSSP
jgi:hypothetical protein